MTVFMFFTLVPYSWRLPAYAGSHTLFRRLRRGPGDRSKTVWVEHLATAFGADIPRCNPRPRSRGRALRACGTKSVCGPNTVSLAGRECAPAQGSKGR